MGTDITEKNPQFIPARVPKPGDIIRRELEARGWTQKDLAHIMDRPEQTISEIANGKKQITPETAIQLGEAFDTSADLWLNLETKYQLHKARQDEKNPDIVQKRRLYEIVPLTEIRRRGWIQCKDSLEELKEAICNFLEIPHLDAQPNVAVTFRQSQIGDPEIAAELAWVKRVEHLAREQSIADFNRDKLLAAIPMLLQYAKVPRHVAKIPELFHRLGIYFVIVPHLTKTYLDGAAFEFEGQPLIALTLRHDRIDNFWFTLLHEMAHVVADHEGSYLDNLEEESEKPAEIEANHMARNWLIDPDALDAFVATTAPYFSEEKIRKFARKQKCHPGIVVGRLQYEGLIPYKNLRKLLVPVKKHLKAWIDVPVPR
jgi:HTH-type transcriptional regulator/antitoxin HigA